MGVYEEVGSERLRYKHKEEMQALYRIEDIMSKNDRDAEVFQPVYDILIRKVKNDM